MAGPHLPTQNSVDVAIDEVGRTAHGSVQWLLENVRDKATGKVTFVAPPKTRGNRLDFLICGEDGFSSIAKDLLEAKATADIICWGFDPGMELGDMSTATQKQWSTLEAKGKSYGHEQTGITRAGKTRPRGMRYGELLEQITTRKENPVTVRLLIWYDEKASRLQNSMPGFTDTHFNAGTFGNNVVSKDPPYSNKARHAYCQEWWTRHLPGFQIVHSKADIFDGTIVPSHDSKLKANPNLQIVLRSIATSDVQQALSDEEDQPSEHTDGLSDTVLNISEKSLLEQYPTHHQKPILIDYAYDNGSKAVGYVMGLNSITDFWDRKEHVIDDPLRETWSTKNTNDELAHEKDTQGKVSHAKYRHTKPYQDYACRIVGPALEALHKNFVDGWNAFARDVPKVEPVKPRPPKIPALWENPAHEVQIVRTQPHEHDKSIKQLYYQSTSYARNYIYIENQYFFYPAFARHLKAERKKFCDAWARLSKKPMQEIPTLHMFIVIPHPESDGMVPRTHALLAELGEGQTMQAQEDFGKKKNEKSQPDPLHRPSKKELEKTLGLKVSVARLRTCGLDANNRMAYREIYIHSKLMLIDDVFVTLGSANINQRSMAVDSEINIAATGLVWAADLRKRVFEMHSGGAVLGSGDREKMPDVYKSWNTTMTTNNLAMKDGMALNGFLLPFEDHRATGKMYAQVTVPSASSITMAA